jgi:ubiquinone/menaquinone biosynthesis C-methylase UbiE
MSKIISEKRFMQAQDYESQYWNNRLCDPVGVIKDLEGVFELGQILQQNRYLKQTFNRTLDVGCGGLGLGLLWLIKTKSSFGLDPLEVKKPNFECQTLDNFVLEVQKKSSYTQAGAEKMPYEDAFFDLVICNNVLDHVHNPFAILNEIKRVLSHDGLFAFSVDTHSLRTIFQKKVVKFVNPNYGSLPGHPYEWTEKQMENILTQYGFKVECHKERSFKGTLLGAVRRTTWLLRH